MNNWHLVKCKFTKEFTDGTLKRVTDQFLISAMSFTEAEARAYKEIGEHVKGEFLVKSIATVEYADVFEYDDSDLWHKVKLEYVSENADNGREMTIKNNYLVSAADVDEAYKRIIDSMEGLMVTFKISSISETKIIEIFPYNPDCAALDAAKIKLEICEILQIATQSGSDVVEKLADAIIEMK